MHYEIVCSVVRGVDDPEDATRKALLEAVAAFEQAVRRRGLAAVVQVRDLHCGLTLHEAIHPGSFAPQPAAQRETPLP